MFLENSSLSYLCNQGLIDSVLETSFTLKLQQSNISIKAIVSIFVVNAIKHKKLTNRRKVGKKYLGFSIKGKVGTIYGDIDMRICADKGGNN